MLAKIKYQISIYLLIVFSTLCFNHVLYAQVEKTGSATQVDYSQMSYNELTSYVNQLRKRSNDSAVLVSQIICEKALSNNDLEGQIKALILLSEIHLMAGNVQKAYENIEFFTRLAEESNNNRLKSISNAGLAKIALIQKEYKSCLQYYFEALGYAELTKDSEFIGKTLFQIAKIYFSLNDYENAQHYLQRALNTPYAEDNKYLYRLQLFSGDLFLEQNLPDSAMAYYRKSWLVAQKLEHNENDLGLLMESFAKFHIRLNNLDLAIEACESGIQHYLIVGNQDRIATLYTYLAHIYSLQNDYQQALMFNKQALSLRIKLGINHLVISSLNNIGGDFMELNIADSAMWYFEKALEMEKHSKSNFYVSVIYKNIYTLFLRNQEFENALDYYRLFRDFEDSVVFSKNNKSISEMRIKYDLEREVNKSKSLELSKSKDIQLVLVTLSVVLVMMLFLVVYRFREKRKDNKLLQQKNSTINEKNIQLDKALEELKVNEQKYRALASHIPGIVFRLTNEPVEKMVFYNQRFSELTGFTEEEFLNNHHNSISKMILSDDLQGVLEARKTAIDESKPYNIVYRYVHQGSTIKYFNEIGKAVDDNHEGQSSIDGLIFDVTDKKLTEHELMLALEKARESDRLKSTFLSTISHELRTPLNAIIGFSNIINDDTPPQLVSEYLGIIKGSGDHLLELVEDLFDISLIETNNISVHPSTGVIAETINLVDNLIGLEREKMGKTNIQIQTIVPDDKTITIFTDLRKLKQIMINLLKNALKFTAVGKIEFGFTIEKQGERTYFQFFVKDTGIGIPSNKVNFIFDVFRQVDDSDTRLYEGVGIGLSVAKRYVELLDGRIWVETSLGKGSSFYFTLPADPQKEKLTIEEVLPKKIPKSYLGKTILIAEDVPSAYTLLKILLEKEGFVTIWAKNGRQAVDYCQTVPEIQLVLMDLKMPDMSGFDATRAIKKDFPNLPIIAQTAYAVEGDREKAMEAGFDEYIEKPIQKSKMFQIIYEMLANKHKI